MDLIELENSILSSTIIKRGDYNYFIHPLTDGITRLDPNLLKATCEKLAEILNMDVDYILTIESMGIHIASVLSQITGLPVNIIRKKRYGLENEAVFDQSTGYGKGTLYMNGVEEGERVVIVDSVISTGGTLVAVLNELKNRDVEVVDVGCIIGKDDGKTTVKEKTGVSVKTLLDIKLTDKVEIIGRISDGRT